VKSDDQEKKSSCCKPKTCCSDKVDVPPKQACCSPKEPAPCCTMNPRKESKVEKVVETHHRIYTFSKKLPW
jgi:hypothetical protein